MKQTVQSADREKIAQLTLEYGGPWAINHARRLLHLVGLIGEGSAYDTEVVWLAAYLHDWGGYPKWILKDVEHQLRSVQVVEPFLRESGLDDALIRPVLDCIENHHGGLPGRRLESILFTDADALDFLGVVGALRVFSMHHRDLRAAWQALHSWRDRSIPILTLETSKALARNRIEETDQILKAFEEETFGYF